MSDSAETIVHIIKELIHGYHEAQKYGTTDPVLVLEDIDMIVNQKTIEITFDD